MLNNISYITFTASMTSPQVLKDYLFAIRCAQSNKIADKNFKNINNIIKKKCKVKLYIINEIDFLNEYRAATNSFNDDRIGVYRIYTKYNNYGYFVKLLKKLSIKYDSEFIGTFYSQENQISIYGVDN